MVYERCTEEEGEGRCDVNLFQWKPFKNRKIKLRNTNSIVRATIDISKENLQIKEKNPKN